MTNFKIITLGCKVNQCESEALEQQIEIKGGRRITLDESADLAIINTCTVTGKAAMQSRQAIRRAIRENGEAQIVVTGCYARTDPSVVRALGDRVHVVDHISDRIITSVLTSPTGPLPVSTSSSSKPSLPLGPNGAESHPAFSPLAVGAAAGRTRPFLKIQDGCNARCTYCIVPRARGRSRSMPMDAVLKALRQLQTNGYHEAVLTGIHLGAYGRDLTPELSLSDLLQGVVTHPSPERIRLSSIEPRELTDTIIEHVVQNECFCQHFHIPLQSGNDEVLKRMNRPYDRGFFKRRVQKIAHHLPDAAIGADVLVGFPGESDDAFENTMALIKALPIAYLHVFPFSARPGTIAAKYPDPNPPETIKARCRRLRNLGREKSIRFYRRFIGRELTVLIEGKSDRATGRLKGLSSNYIHVLIEGRDNLKNHLVQVQLTRVDENSRVLGSIIE